MWFSLYHFDRNHKAKFQSKTLRTSNLRNHCQKSEASKITNVKYREAFVQYLDLEIDHE